MQNNEQGTNSQMRSLKNCLLNLIFYLSMSLQALAAPNFSTLQTQIGKDQLLFISLSDQAELLINADSVSHLKQYDSKFLREPLYDEYLQASLLAMLGYKGFQHLFRNLGGGFVPIKVKDELLVMKGTRDHCGGMEEAMVLVDLNTGDITSLLYSEDSILIHSSLKSSLYLPNEALHWVKRLYDAYGTKQQPTQNKIQLRKMAGNWCRYEAS